MSGQLSCKGLSLEQMKSLYSDGFLRPCESVVDPALVDSMAAKILTHMRTRDSHPLYGRHSVRDWHLVYPELVEFVSNDEVLGQLASVMGENLILWRSHVFYKAPGTGPIGWHQDFGTFSGEDIGNNKVSLVPAHIPGFTEHHLASYLPDALKQSTYQPAPDNTDFWNITVWVALSDIAHNMGPLRFLPGSHRKRYPVRMKSLNESDFWQNPFSGITSKEHLLKACRDSKLVLDVDTSTILEGISVDAYSQQELEHLILGKLRQVEGSTTLVDELDEEVAESFPMAKGSYILFSERTLHGSSANTSDLERLAINFRVTTSSTLVYPSRLRGDFVDGFNIDVSNHKCILLSGENLNKNNCVI